MIGYLKGTIIEFTADTAIICVGGVGYEVYCSGAAFSKMTIGKECEVYTCMNVSEQNGVQLFGFESRREKEMFLRLTSVSGVGPKLAIAVLSSMNVAEAATAIATSDTKRLTAVKGLGKKTAERIVLELRESVTVPLSKGEFDGAPPVAIPQKDSGDEDAAVALISLGFTRAESESAVLKAKQKGAKTVEEIIMSALKGM